MRVGARSVPFACAHPTPPSGFSCGVADGYGVLIPVGEVTARKPVRVDAAGPAFARMCLITGQPMLCTDMTC